MRQAEAAHAAVSSVTWHAGGPTNPPGSWARTCYAIVDGTWQPVPVSRGQAEADSAWLLPGAKSVKAPRLVSPWVSD
jgi:hypothetical protein